MRLYDRIISENDDDKRTALIAEYIHKAKWAGVHSAVKTAYNDFGFKRSMMVASELTDYNYSDNLTYVRGVIK